MPRRRPSISRISPPPPLSLSLSTNRRRHCLRATLRSVNRARTRNVTTRARASQAEPSRAEPSGVSRALSRNSARNRLLRLLKARRTVSRYSARAEHSPGSLREFTHYASLWDLLLDLLHRAATGPICRELNPISAFRDMFRYKYKLRDSTWPPCVSSRLIG